MNLAIARKELKEMLPLIVLAGLVQFRLLFGTLGLLPAWMGNFGPRNMIPFFDLPNGGGLVTVLVLVGGCLAIGLGLGQTMWELFRGTFPFLFHRPLSRTEIFGSKLLVGVGMWLALTVLPIFIYALWAATPGTHASPFAWSMTAGAVPLCLAVLLIYLAAFLCGLRPARWYASRFLPGVFAGCLVIISLILPLGAVWASIVLLTACAGYLVVILQVAQTRDYS
jgi:ABC-type transport system involved in multi-copper enzyme maturation permease subunit